MIIMHYRFNLPADYDMSVIEKRITDNGTRLNSFTGLLFKAYLFSRREDILLASEENPSPLGA